MSAIDIQTITSAALAEVKDHGIATTSLPQGFPTIINSKAGWVSADFSGKAKGTFSYILHLSDDENAEISQTLTTFKDMSLDGTAVNKHNFILPTLGAKLQDLRKEIHTGRGFAVIRGLDAAKFGVGDLTIIYMGIASYISDQIGRQDGSGNALVHIIADKKEAAHHRHSTDPITFHTEEAADVVAWLTRSAAAEGGRCVISSVATIYNVLCATRPDLDGRVLLNFGRAALMGSAANPRKAHLPALTAQQKEALDAVEAIARATEFAFATKPGDIHFINNMTVLHRRDGFTDGAGTEQRRHLVRMRLSDSVYGTDIPSLRREWADAFNQEDDRTFHIEPMPAGYFPLRKYPN